MARYLTVLTVPSRSGRPAPRSPPPWSPLCADGHRTGADLPSGPGDSRQVLCRWGYAPSCAPRLGNLLLVGRSGCQWVQVRRSSTAARFYSLSANFRSKQMKVVGWFTVCNIGSPIATSAAKPHSPLVQVHRKQHPSPSRLTECNKWLQYTTVLSWPHLRTTAKSIQRPRSPAEPHPPSLAWVEAPAA